MSRYDGTYLFAYDGEYYYYDLASNMIMQVTKLLYDVISKYLSGDYLDDQETRIVDKFCRLGLLQESVEIAEDPSEEENAYLTFAPTYKCNFRCSYCFGECGNKYTDETREFSKSGLIDMLDYFFTKAYPDAKNYRIDFVSGGEPLLGMEIIKNTIEYLETKIRPLKKRVSVWLCTNGSLLTEEIIEYLSLHNISIGISLDGAKEYNDMYRKDAFGNGTYDRICEGIRLVHESVRVSKKFKNIWGLCAATNDNCDFVATLMHMKSLGFQNIQIRLIRTAENYAVEKILAEYEKLVEHFINEFKVGNIDDLLMVLNDNDQFGKVLRRILLGHVLIRRCGAGVNKMTICPNGDIYPCDSFVGITKFRMGSIFSSDKSLELELKNGCVTQIEKCSKCNIRYLCGGDCYYNAYMKNGNALRPDDEFCAVQRRIIELAIVLKCKMECMDAELFKKLYMEVKRRYDYAEIFG